MYISRIEEGSLAERANLRPGDTILEVNGTPFTSINHDEALKVSEIKSNNDATNLTLKFVIYMLLSLPL